MRQNRKDFIEINKIYVVGKCRFQQLIQTMSEMT
jgi:hypothetical protein